VTRVLSEKNLEQFSFVLALKEEKFTNECGNTDSVTLLGKVPLSK
jgi:hypothetical protein